MSGYGLAIDSILRRNCDDPFPPIILAVAATDWADLASPGTRLLDFRHRMGALHMHQCLVASFALACARKTRIISRLASGPRASV